MQKNLLKTSETIIKVGLIGCGRISENHIKAILSFPKDCKLVAICDIRSKNLE